MRRLFTLLAWVTVLGTAHASAQNQLELWANNGASTLGAGINNSTTTITVASGHGARFPSPTGSQYFWVTLEESTTVEIVKCTARATDSLTCTRAQQSTTAAAFTTAAKVENRITKTTLDSVLWDGFNKVTNGMINTGHVCFGGDCTGVGNNSDTITINANRSDTGAPGFHAIGISNTLVTTWTANGATQCPVEGTPCNHVLFDSLSIPSPRTGVTIPEAMIFSSNHWMGADASSDGVITELIGLNINPSVRIDAGAAMTVGTQYGIKIKDMCSITGGTGGNPTNCASIRSANNNWVKWRNAADSSDLSALKVNASNNVEFGIPAAHTIAYVAATTGNITAQREFADGTVTRSLPTAASSTGVEYSISNVGTGVLTIAALGGTISGGTVIKPGLARRYISNGSNWFEIATTSGPWTTLRQAADQTTTANTTTRVASTDLTFAMVASTDYAVECSLLYTGNTATNGIGLTVDLSGTVTSIAHQVTIGGFAADGAASAFLGTINADIDDVIATAVVATGTLYNARISGIVRNDGSADNWTINFRNEVAVAANTVTLKAGSYCEYRIAQ